MIIGLIGVGVVGGTLKKWFNENTDHKLKLYDPGKGLLDDLKGIDACFISVPVTANGYGQNQEILSQAVKVAKAHTEHVFIRSTVLPGTCDHYKCYSMPEFLTERRSYEDMCNLPLLFGDAPKGLVEEIFKNKEKIFVSNKEAELAKFTHNCFGAMKVTYFNIINSICQTSKCDYKNVLMASMLTGFIEKEHTSVPGHDGKYGYGGKCFPENIEAFKGFLSKEPYLSSSYRDFFSCISNINYSLRKKV